MGNKTSKICEGSSESSTGVEEKQSASDVRQQQEDLTDALTINNIDTAVAEEDQPSTNIQRAQQTAADQPRPSEGHKRITATSNDRTTSSDDVRIENRRDNQNLKEVNKAMRIPKEETEGQAEIKNNKIEQLKWGQELQLRCERLDTEAQELKTKLEAKTTECEELTIRLSRIASDRLKHENPNIVDLGDPNRPQKLGDKFAELYCNEWIDAHEDLTSHKMSDKEATQLLLELMKTIYTTCYETSIQQLTAFKQQIMLFTGHAFSGQSLKNRPELSTKPYKEERKKQYMSFLESINNCLKTSLPRLLTKKTKKTKTLDKYITVSTELCWLMCVQDPPVELVFTGRKGEPFDETFYTYYTKSGNKIDYVVWPVILLYKDGPVIRKGVAEGNGNEGKTKGKMT